MMRDVAVWPQGIEGGTEDGLNDLFVGKVVHVCKECIQKATFAVADVLTGFCDV